MSKLKLLKLSFFLIFMVSLNAYADWLDKLKQAQDVINQTGILNKTGVFNQTEDPNAAPNKTTTMRTSRLELPLGLIEYPRAVLEKEVVDPYDDEVVIPISVPIKQPSGETRARYEVPAAGKVTILQYKHKGDDSPLLIQKHYESWLADKGFDRLLMCKSPCKEMGSYWDMRNIIDNKRRAEPNLFPADPAYFTALRDDAMVLVGVGKYSQEYISVIKIVEGKILDRSNWDKLKQPVTLPPAVKPSKPVSKLPSTSGVTSISPDDALGYVESAKGLTYVHVSSYDRNCGFCIRSNPEFDKFSVYHAGKAAFLQIAIQPWKDVFNNQFVKKFNVSGLPTTLAFENGQLISRHDGVFTVDELNKSLIK